MLGLCTAVSGALAAWPGSIPDGMACPAAAVPATSSLSTAPLQASLPEGPRSKPMSPRVTTCREPPCAAAGSSPGASSARNCSVPPNSHASASFASSRRRRRLADLREFFLLGDPVGDATEGSSKDSSSTELTTRPSERSLHLARTSGSTGGAAGGSMSAAAAAAAAGKARGSVGGSVGAVRSDGGARAGGLGSESAISDLCASSFTASRSAGCNSASKRR
mmetsp:Transcript_33130/g.98615  ORF Transcript_33130/g.98615 Transcript_33130/m.98615 type:complete len:221 (+) Transcript_33130:470-1132(+)